MAADILADVREREEEAEDKMQSESRKRDINLFCSKCRQIKGERDEAGTK